MELFYFIGLFMILAKSTDAAVAYTTPPASGTSACPTLATVAEGTKTGDLVTSATTGGTGPYTYAMAAGGTDKAMFEVSAAGVVSIKSTAALDFETKASYIVQVEVTDTGDSDAKAEGTCTIAVTDVSPWFSSFASKVVVPDSAADTDPITSVVCTDGADTKGYTYAKTGGDDATAKFSLNTGTGALTKTAVAFDVATKAYYILTFTCVDGANTATATVTVCLNNESNCPSKASINHGVLAGLVVPTLFAIYHLI